MRNRWSAAITGNEEQQLVQAISGIAQSINALLALLHETQARRVKADGEIIALLKLISRKH